MVVGVVIDPNYPDRTALSQIIVGWGTICGMAAVQFALIGFYRHFARMQYLLAVAAESTTAPLLATRDEIRILDSPVAAAATRALPAVAACCLCR